MKVFKICALFSGLLLSSSLASAAVTEIKSAQLKSSGGDVVTDISSYELNKEPLTIAVSLSSKPSQVSFVLKTDEDIEIVYPATYKSTAEQYQLTVPLSKIPKVFKSQDKITVELICGDLKDTRLNLHERLFDIAVSASLQEKTAATYHPSLRYGPLPEIYHIFKEQQEFINPAIPVAFIGGIEVLFIALLKYWFSLGFKFVAFSSMDILFIVSLVAYQVIFVRYYIADSIFTTIGRLAMLTPVSVFSGSRALRKLNQRNSTTAKKDL